MPPKQFMTLIKILDVAWPNKPLEIAANRHLDTLLAYSVMLLPVARAVLSP